MDWKTFFLSPEGRIERRDFWIGFAIIVVASFVLGVIPILGQLLGFLLLWPQICIHSKRLHDMGKTAWLQLIPFGATVIAMVLAAVSGGMAMMGAASMNEQGDDSAAVGSAMAGMGAALGFMGLAFLVGLAFLLWVGLTKGEPGPNRFGPPPVSQVNFV
ncbi:DUF805 domain-containing protein [Archangium minus]|uniref:DUF805 domain-containing protein n=1 Tax=Archangium minus TaxID=83450 RepID=A0ABY9WRW4_9BACT|nr:DUF805 domain-containing protein [Archangium minus]